MNTHLQNISAIIFDLGGVIINLDTTRTYKAFERLGVPQLEQQFTYTQQEQVFKDFEVGGITIEAFRNSFRTHITQPVSDEEIDAAWCAMLLDIPKHRLELLKQLKEKYKLYLLSNTNSIHMGWINNYLQREYGMANLNPLFDACYYSQEIGARKPNAEAFTHVINAHSLAPETTLFLDDTKSNITTASHLGIQTVFVEKDVAEYFSL